MKLSDFAATISRFKKERFLKKLTEDDFRDRVVRPLLLLRGMKDGRDLCGPEEAGKDSIFVTENVLGQLDVYALQTKRGNLNLGGSVSANIVEVITQLKTTRDKYRVASAEQRTRSRQPRAPLYKRQNQPISPDAHSRSCREPKHILLGLR